MSEDRGVYVVHDDRGNWSGVVREAEPDGTKWLAMLIRQGLLLIVRGIETRYGLSKPRT